MDSSRSVELEPLAVVGGVRTPFAKAFGPLADVQADELGRIAGTSALERAQMQPDQVDEVVFGNVSGPAETSNVARIIALRTGVPDDRIAHTVNRNCASGMEAFFSAWQILREGRADVILAGGTESMSNVPFLWDPKAKDWFMQLSQQKTWSKKAGVLTKFRPSLMKPVVGLQVGLTDPTCGLNMGQTAEVLAREFGISREEQDLFSLHSHQRALAAWERCFYGGETVPIPGMITGGAPLEKDTGPRPGQTLESLAKLKPVFEREGGTVTVGNSCPITDGAASAVLMTASHARELGVRPLGYVRAYALAGCQPGRMGLGPVFAINKLLSKTHMHLNDFDLFEINEAFAAQVLSCLKALNSDSFAKHELNSDHAVGELNPEKLNVNGGAIALGHPVGTTGARLIITLLRALREKGLRRGIASLCVGGGQGAAAWVETELDG
jgi:acetyl-CoA C-acetyltransferase/acetyl-CoA acyltransferase